METLGRSNPRIAALRKLMGSAQARRDVGSFVLEGPKAAEALIEGGHAIDWAICTDAFSTGEGQAVVSRLQEAGVEVFTVTPGLLGQVSDTRTPQGLLLVVSLPEPLPVDQLVPGGRNLLVCVSVQDPGNVGALVRVAAAAGMGAVLVDRASADPFGPRAARASAATVLSLPVLRVAELESEVSRAQDAGIRVVATVSRGGTPLHEADLSAQSAFLLGGEGAGLPPPLIELADVRVSIPMERGVESLNVAVAGGLLAFEARRQQRA